MACGTSDSRLLLASVFVRMFSYGWLAVILFLYLFRLGFDEWQVGTLLTSTLLGDLLITLYLTTHATRHGRRNTLMISAVGKVLAGAGLVWASVGLTDDEPPSVTQYWILVVSGTVGVLTPTGGDIGPFKAVEQAALSELVSREKEEVARAASAQRGTSARPKSANIPILSGGDAHALDSELHDDEDDDEDTAVAQAAAMHRAVMDGLNWMTGYYALIAAWALALGALASGFTVTWLQRGNAQADGVEDDVTANSSGWLSGYTDLQAYRVVCLGYTFFGFVMALLFWRLSDAVEPDAHKVDHLETAGRAKSMWSHLGLHRPGTIAVVAKLSALFVLDAFAGGLVMQTFITYWFHARYGMSEEWLGALLMGANFLGGLSALVAAPMASRFGEINTMVWTHLPSNVLLIAVVLMPNALWACVMLLARFSISQMDVPARSAYVNGVVARDERDAANGITNLIRSLGVSAAPVCLSWMITGGAPSPGATWASAGADGAKVWWFAMPFIASGALKIVYDVLVYVIFNNYCCTCGNREELSSSAATAARVASVTGAGPTDIDRANSAAALSGTGARYQAVPVADR